MTRNKDGYDLWGYVEVDRREGDYQDFQSCSRCGSLVKAGAEDLHDRLHASIDGLTAATVRERTP